ncbi:MAG: hypothetical protein HY676_01030 [Chloroflexi bacterium]|nr:hypothetical protein [Chloroflexota bacterium]
MRGIAIISLLFVLVIAVTLIAVRVNALVKARDKQVNNKLVKDVEWNHMDNKKKIAIGAVIVGVIAGVLGAVWLIKKGKRGKS